MEILPWFWLNTPKPNVCSCFRVIVVMYTGEMIENDTIPRIIDLTVIWQI